MINKSRRLVASAAVGAMSVLAFGAQAEAQSGASSDQAATATVRQVAQTYFGEVDKGFVEKSAPTRQLGRLLASGGPLEIKAKAAGAYEETRSQKFRSWARGHKDTYHSVTSSLTPQAITVSGDTASVAGTVETTMLWSSAATPSVAPTKEKAASIADAKADGRAFGPGDIVTTKVETRHDMKFERTNGSWRVVSDRYLDPFDSSLAEDHESPRAASSSSNSELAQPKPASLPGKADKPAPIQGVVAATITWNRGNAARYADRYWSSYNTFYPNCNPSGGDCANYVSQVLWDYTAGNLPTTAQWTPGTRASCGATSTAWRYTPSQHSFFIANPRGSTYNFAVLGKKGSASTVRAYNIASMVIGDVMFEDWTSNGAIDHVTIATAYASDNSTLINAHNTNRYHYRWDLGTSSTTYYMDKFKSTITF